MSRNVDICVQVDPSYGSPHVIIKTDEHTPLIDRIVEAIEHCTEEEYPEVVCYSDDKIILLNQNDVTRIYSENRKIIVCSDGKEYRSKQTLVELEKKLDVRRFVRISRFELVNIRRISGFDLSMAGTIKVSLNDGSETWVARRYVRAIQEKFMSINQGGKDHE
ncbi:MAG: LytTR family transcriptional regulator DNA-binding domain-containing protein [Lachnospiraceae bacterium]|nr:LytTR family transcriptional regulator DNA-binding domain-containing protein [Lachnospiraceae bacterium]